MVIIIIAAFVSSATVTLTASAVGWELGREMLYAWTEPSV